MYEKPHEEPYNKESEDTAESVPYYYNVLGVSKNSSLDEIKAAYRRLAMIYPPDISADSDTVEKFREIQNAYEVLSNPEKRTQYDKFENKLSMKMCSFCAEEILADAVKCKHCGEWLNRQSAGQRTHPVVQQYSNAQPIWNLILLSILSFGIYEIYWFYRNWKHLKVHKNLNINPGWRTVGLLVPIYGIILIYRQFKDIDELLLKAKCKKFFYELSPGGATLSYVFFNFLSARISNLPMKYTQITPTGLLAVMIFEIVFFLIAVWVLVDVQKMLNEFWEKEQPHFAIRTKFTNKEIAILLIGGVFWTIFLIGIFIPE